VNENIREFDVQNDKTKSKQPISSFNSNWLDSLPSTIPLKEAYDPFIMSLQTQWEDVIPLGKKYGKLSKNKNVLELGWKDN